LAVVSVFVAATVTFGLVGAVAPASAEGFNFVCSASAEPPDGSGSNPGEFEQLRNGLALALLQGNTLWHFKGLAPPGVPVAGGGTVDPVTGGTLFERTMSPARLGENQNVDFFDPASVPGANGAELSFGLNLRNRAGQANDDLGMKRLFSQNFGVPNDSGTDIEVVGIDIDVDANAAMTALASGFRGAFEGVFVYKLADGTDQVGGVRVTMDSLQATSKIPDDASLSIVFKKPADPNHTFFAFGQKAHYASFNGVDNQPAVGFGMDLAVVEPGPVERDVLSAKADWTAAPRQVALGLAQLCPDRGHVAWNMDPGGLPHPETASLNLKFRSGDRLGQTINVDDGLGGTKSIRADEVVLDGHVDGLPRLMDFIMLRDAMSFTRSGEVAPDVTVDRFHMADDDPATTDDRPLFVTAQATDVPRHLLFHVDRNPTTGAIDRGELTSWTLACPGDPTPPGAPAPPDVRRPDLVDTLPLFPAGCQRHNLAPIPSAEVNVQNWLPEDLDAQAATADLRTAPVDANQYGFFASRDLNSLSTKPLFAFGGRIKGLQRVTVDLRGDPPGGDKTRIYVERAPVPAADDSARFVVDVDARTSLDEVANTKTRVTADATVTDLPNAIRIDSETTDTSPLDITWRADAPFAVTNGTVDAQFPGREAIVVHGAFETGAVGAGPLPPAARVQVTQEADESGGAVHYSAPTAPTDGFPSPVVPAFDPTAIARLHAGAELTSHNDRVDNLGTRVHADIDVPQPVDISWDTSADGRLSSVEGSLCDPATPAACAATRFDATAARGLRGPVAFADLLTPPVLPTATAPVSEAVPAFTEFRPGSGARAVILSPDSWGADARVTGVARFFYHREPQDIGVQLANTTDQPFRVNLLDASQVVDIGADPRPQLIFADAALDRLPQNIRIRQSDLASAPDQPWLWVNTEDLAIDDIGDVDFSEDPAGTRPRLTGVLRIGDAQALRDELPVAAPTRDGSVSGADVRADFDLDNQLLALDGSASVEVPRHVAIFRPTLVRCDETSADVSSCQNRQTYEIDKTETVAVQFKTTAHEFGDLNVNGDIHGDGLDWTVDGRVEHVPGSFVGGLTLANNLRLPWVDINVDFNANAPLGAVRASVFDHNLPVEYRQDADPVDQGQCTETDDQCTANYAVELTNVPAELHVAAKIQGAAEDRLTPSPVEPPDPAEPETDVGGIAYVHAQLDLGGTATQLLVQGREASDGQFVGILKAFDAADAPTAVSGFLNARVDHITTSLNNPTDPSDPFEEFVFDGGGLVGAISGNVTVGRIFQLLTLPLDLIIGAFLELFFDGTLTTKFDLDFDLPLFVGFDRVDTIRFGMSGPTLSVDEHHPGDGGPATIATRQQSLASESDLTVDGGFFHHRDVKFAFDPILEDFDISNSTDDSLQDLGIFQHSKCKTQDEDNVCYFLATNEVTLDQVSASPREDGFTSGDALLDFFFTADNRSEMDDENTGFVEPGVEFYKGLANASDPVEASAFFLPDLATAPVAINEATFGERSVCCNTTSFAQFQTGEDPPPPPTTQNFGAVCDISTSDGVAGGPRAIGSDGTEYVVVVVRSNAVPEDAGRTFCDATRLVLEAHYPANPADGAGAIGQVRWSITLPTPDGLEPGGECIVEDVRCEFATTVTPQADGSVRVATDTTKFTDGVDGASIDTTVFVSFPPSGDFAKRLALGACCPSPDIQDGESSTLGTARTWVDASGHPGFHRQEAARVDGFSAAAVAGDEAGNASLDPCVIAPSFGCSALPDGETAQWVFGDGTLTDKLGGDLDTQAHRYPHTPGADSHLGILIHYDGNGEVVDKAYFTVAT
jgi:hypothetical protein